MKAMSGGATSVGRSVDSFSTIGRAILYSGNLTSIMGFYEMVIHLHKIYYITSNQIGLSPILIKQIKIQMQPSILKPYLLYLLKESSGSQLSLQNAMRL